MYVVRNLNKYTYDFMKKNKNREAYRYLTLVLVGENILNSKAIINPLHSIFRKKTILKRIFGILLFYINKTIGRYHDNWKCYFRFFVIEGKFLLRLKKLLLNQKLTSLKYQP